MTVNLRGWPVAAPLQRSVRSSPATSAGAPPLSSRLRKSERCTETRLIDPSASTPTAFQSDGPCRMT